MAEVIAFAGPSLPAVPDRPLRELLSGVELRPPAGRGDVLSALSERPRALVLLDGYYYTRPSPTHKELLYALDAGVTVIGAASLGALRAAELDGCGMLGAGRIYEWYRDGVLDGDDEVAVLHLPAEHGYRPVTLALVEVRHALSKVLGGAPARRRQDLVEAVKALPFVDRDRERLAALAEEHLGRDGAAELERQLRRESLKEADAKLALELARRRRRPRPRAAGVGVYLSFYREKYLRAPSRPDDARPAPSLVHAWNMVQVFHPRAPELVVHLRRRFLLASSAHQAGLDVTPELERDALDRLRESVRRGSRTPPLPEVEVLEEARLRALAERAVEHFGDARRALRSLAAKLALAPERGPELLMRRLASQFDLMPGWFLLRGFLFTTALEPALAAAAEAEEIARCFERWSRGARIAKADLWRLAAELWGCGAGEVECEGGRRGLFQTDGYSPGLREALQLVAPAERLGRPINGYPASKARLQEHDLELAPDQLARS